ncbi:MAG: hypothetical protein AB1757_09130 [Acidobacteriota bacterium]
MKARKPFIVMGTLKLKNTTVDYRSGLRMLCPCCGKEIKRDVLECNCGAKFVGAPLDEKPVQIKSYGHVMNTFGLLAVVITAALVFTKFFAIGAIPVIWYTWRSLQRSRKNPEQFGGYKVLMPTFALTLIASFVIAGFAVAYIPRLLENRRIKKEAASMAAIHRKAAFLEAFKLVNGSYPKDEQELRKFAKEQLPLDYWEHNISYTGFTDGIATNVTQRKGNDKSLILTQGLGWNNFELRSNGPDELPNTDDDIIMRDGVFYTAAELKGQLLIKTSAK